MRFNRLVAAGQPAVTFALARLASAQAAPRCAENGTHFPVVAPRLNAVQELTVGNYCATSASTARTNF